MDSFIDLTKTAIAYLLDNPILTWGGIVLYFCFSNQSLTSKNKKVTAEKEKLEKEKEALEVDASLGRSFSTAIKALKS